MALAIDASSPAVFSGSTATITSASFTPPAGSLLVVTFAGNSNTGANPNAPTIADSLTPDLTYTRQVWRSRADGSPVVDGHAAIWTAPVVNSVAMTVSVTSDTVEKACRIWVLTGQDTTDPIGAIGGAGSASSAAIAQSYTAESTGGQGFMSVCDWSALGSMTAGSGCTLDGTGTVGGSQISYGFARRTTADDVNTVANTLRANPNGTSTALQWCWVEINPAAAASPALPQLIIRMRVKPLMPARRTEAATPVAPQQNPPVPLARVSQPRLIRMLRGRRTRAATPTPPQVNPLIPLRTLVQPRRLRGLQGWRTRLGRVPLVGAAPPAPPALPLATPRHAVRPMPWHRRTRTAATVPAQQSQPPPALPLATPRHAVRPMPWHRRTRAATPVPAQVNPPVNPPLPLKAAVAARRLRGLQANRRRIVTPFAQPQNPPLPLKHIVAPRRFPRGLALWRTRLGCVPLVGVGTAPGSGTVVLPPGLVPVRTLTTAQLLTGNRSTRLRYDLFTRTEAALGDLTGVEKGTVDFTAQASVKSGGALNIVDVGQTVDWLNDRVRPVVIIEGLPEIPLGMFLFSEAPEQWGHTERMWSIKLLDKTSILDQDAVDATYALDAGTVITTAVVTLIASTGEANIAVTPSAATLSGPLAWAAGTTKLRIVNDLLAAAGYFSLFADRLGQFRGEPYVRPANRPIRYEFLDGDTSIYSPDFVKDVDLFAIPNKFVAVGQGDAATEALVSIATNTDPASPYSFAARGRWIVKSATGVEAASQAVLDDYARRRLIELTSPTSSIDVAHALVPDLTFNTAVRLRRVPAGVDARHVVTKMVVPLDPTALVKTTLQEVVDL